VDERSHELELAQLGPRFPAERSMAGRLPDTALLAAIDDDFRCGSTKRDI